MFFRITGWRRGKNHHLISYINREKNEEYNYKDVGELSQNILDDLDILRLVVIEKILDYSDIENVTYVDVMKMNAMLDMRQDYKNVSEQIEYEKLRAMEKR